jgi:hypothetical protein
MRMRIYNGIIILLSTLFWLAVASLPLLPIYLGQKRLESLGCEFGSECFRYTMSFVPAQTDFLIISSLLLWPLVIIKLWDIVRRVRGKESEPVANKQGVRVNFTKFNGDI